MLRDGLLAGVEVGGQREDRDLLALALLPGDHPAGRERPPVPDPVDRVADLLVGSPGRRKYECSECTARSAGTVRPAAMSA